MNLFEKARTKRTPIHLKPLQWVIVALCLALVLNILFFCVEVLNEVKGYQPSERTLLYYIQSDYYEWLRYDFADYTPAEIAANETLSECYNVTLYFENSVLYYAYATCDAEKAAQYQIARQENAENAGALSYKIAEIDAFFSEME